MTKILPFKRGRLPKETVECIRRMLRQAELGRITGLAFVAWVPNGFIADACGDAHFKPIETLEMLHHLERRLVRRISSLHPE